MDVIVAKADGSEICYLDDERNLDIDLGDTNDFLMELKLDNWCDKTFGYGNQIFIQNTEYGGIIGDVGVTTKNEIVSIYGDTWRGMLNKKIIEPPKGQTYLVLTGDLNSILREVIGTRFGDLFLVKDKPTGVIITYQFDRYTTLLHGLEKMLATVNYRLSIAYMQGSAGAIGYVNIEAVPVMDYSEDIEFSQDSRIHFSTRDYRRGINHLICAGEGEGINRTVLHLYVQKDGTIGDNQYYTGIEERAALYSYTSQDDVVKLKEDGAKRIKELMNYKQFDMTVEDVNLEIGDIVSGRDRITNTLIRSPIVNKILKIQGRKETIDYKLKGDD